MRLKTRLLSFGVMAAVAASLPASALAQVASEQARAMVRLDIPAGPAAQGLNALATQADVQLFYPYKLVAGRSIGAVKGEFTRDEAIQQMAAAAGLTVARNDGRTVTLEDPQGGSAAGSGASEVEALIVTAQKREENIQDVPIAMSAFSQETLTERQVAGGPDLITQIPNMSFTKTNFTSYSIQIRGIGTQAISATTDPAVAVAFNNTPFVRNRFFEQEFYDLERLEVLRGPQGTLYGRNATAGVVNLISAKPKFTFDAKASADIANYGSSRIEGMVNIPLVEDVVALRLAGAWTRRDGYVSNQMTGRQIDGRDLWSTRLSLRFEPTDWISANLIWEHFEEDDDRLRSGKQLCKKHLVDKIGTLPVPPNSGGFEGVITYASQGCEAVSLYSAEAFQTPNGFALPFYGPTSGLGNPVDNDKDPYLNSAQSRDLRVIESSVEPEYRAHSDIAEFQVSLDISENLTLNSETAYSSDSVFSLQDYNRFTTVEKAFKPRADLRPGLLDANGVFCDPQLGCSDRLLLVDLSTSESSQFSQEFRLGSDFEGPLNFSLGANFLRHDAFDKYYVFINSLTLFAAYTSTPGARPYSPENPNLTSSTLFSPGNVGDTASYFDPSAAYNITPVYIDPNPIDGLNDLGRNYFLSKNPYKLISYATFGELYYELTDTLKVTAGLRFTVDKKVAPQIPSWLLAGYSASQYPTLQTISQEWREPTGRLTIDWKPTLAFTDETLVYASYAHGYKAGGANPPPPVFAVYGESQDEVGREELPDVFGPEFVDAFEVGTKNTLLSGAMTLNLTGFYYDYKGYQTSEIRNRSAVNSNFDAEVWGAELEADWRVTDALRLGFKGGYNGTRMADGQRAIDLMDRTAGRTDWVVLRPFPTIPSNCVVPVFVVTAGDILRVRPVANNISQNGVCVDAYYMGYDPVTNLPYVPNPTVIRNTAFTPVPPGYIGWNPLDESQGHNGGKGFFKDLSGNELPNAPRYTSTVTVDYTLPLAGDWLLTLHGDYHYQAASWARVFNSDPYDRINAFSTVNLAGIFTNDEAGWRVMAYVKNVFDEDAITGAFLNSDDSGLTTNVFLTEPRLYGIRVTKDWTGMNGFWGFGDGSRRPAGEPYPFMVEFGGGLTREGGDNEVYAPEWLEEYSDAFPLGQSLPREEFDWGETGSVKLTYAPSKDWRIAAGYRFGKTKSRPILGSGYEHIPGSIQEKTSPLFEKYDAYVASEPNHLRAVVQGTDDHAIIDFTVGRNVGFGMGQGSSMLSAGLRRAELQSTASAKIDGVPNRVQRADHSPLTPYDRYTSMLESERSFEGLGPVIEWQGSFPVLGDEERGLMSVDWTVSGGVLFGSQDMTSEETLYFGHYTTATAGVALDSVVTRSRSGDATVPSASVQLGLSYAIDRVKVSTGYSYDRFFDAIDGGYTETQTYDRTIHGPYLKLSLGFGG